MGWTHRSETDHDQTFGLIAKRFREDSEQVTREALPARWVDLILHLDEQERNAHARSQHAAGELRVAAAELAVSSQEAVLRELMRTEEPTAEATALLEEFAPKSCERGC
jgi:hypothetical protein